MELATTKTLVLELLFLYFILTGTLFILFSHFNEAPTVSIVSLNHYLRGIEAKIIIWIPVIMEIICVRFFFSHELTTVYIDVSSQESFQPGNVGSSAISISTTANCAATNAFTIPIPANITVCYWTKGGSGGQTPTHWSFTEGTTSKWLLRRFISNAIFEIGAAQSIQSTGRINDGSWYHICFQYREAGNYETICSHNFQAKIHGQRLF